MGYKRLAVIFIFFLLYMHSAVAKDNPHLFSHPNINKELFGKSPAVLMKDRLFGFIWIGTKYGLYKYDMTSWEHFTPVKGDSNSLSSAEVTALLHDSRGGIWIGTTNGLNYFDHQTGRFTRIFHDPENENSLVDNKVYTLIEDHQGQVWIGTKLGISIHAPGSARFEFKNYVPGKDIDFTTPVNLFQDNKNRVWICSFKQGLYKYVPGEKRFYRYYPDQSGHSIPSRTVYDVYQDTDGLVWFSNQGGEIYYYDEGADHFNFPTREQFPVLYNFVDQKSTRFYKDSKGELWIGNLHGLYSLNANPDGLVHYYHTIENDHSLVDNEVIDIVEDDFKNLWVLTKKGLNVLHLPAMGYMTVYSLPSKPNGNEPVAANCIFPASKNSYWVGTNAGIFQITKQSTKPVKTHFSPKHYSDINKMLIHGDKLWLAGVGIWLKENEQMTHLRPLPGENSLQGWYVFDLHLDNEGVAWICTGAGLNQFDPGTGQFIFHEIHPFVETPAMEDKNL